MVVANDFSVLITTSLSAVAFRRRYRGSLKWDGAIKSVVYGRLWVTNGRIYTITFWRSVRITLINDVCYATLLIALLVNRYYLIVAAIAYRELSYRVSQ